MRPTLFTTRFLSLLALCGSLALLAGCPVPADTEVASSGDDGSKGVFYAAPNKLFDKSTKFDIRWTVTHEPQVDTFDPAINIGNRELAINRCTNCHECGFSVAFDLPSYGKQNWSPRYTGEQWSNPVLRMMTKNNNFLNDAISERIYTFLKKETTVGYDESADTKGAVTIETDESGNPIQHERATTPQPSR